jgi:hypothetical protein
MRDYRQQWWPATYVGAGVLRDVAGIARHAGGDRWEFQWIDPVPGPQRVATRSVTVFRTEIDVTVPTA